MAPEINIIWQKPLDYFELKGYELPPHVGYLYKEVMAFRTGFKLLMIGHSFSKKVDLTNNGFKLHDVLSDYNHIHSNNWRGISVGLIESKIELSRPQIKELVSLEVMAHPKKYYPQLANHHFPEDYNLKNFYTIYNSGFRDDKMVFKISYDFEVTP